MTRARSFNEKHRKSAKVTTVVALSLVLITSILFQIAELLFDLYKAATATRKRRLGILIVAVLLITIMVAGNWDFSKSIEAAEQPQTQEQELVAEEPVSEEPKIHHDVITSNKDSEEPTEQAHVHQPTKDWDTSGVDIASFLAQFPGMVGWVYFEDGHISYPIMQADDNEKYLSVGPTGEPAWEGAIFLDHRSASDFSDPNSIVYGHNMKDDTMFGSLRDYREDDDYYNDHQYFQIITPEKRMRYQIFEYMDVSEDYVLYDYVGEASAEFVKDAEPVRVKSYMDSEIVVDETKKVVTLSTCTPKDERQFVVLGVLVDEDNN